MSGKIPPLLCAFLLASLFQGCGYYPPSASSKVAIYRLSQKHVSLACRRLADEDIPALASRQNLQMLFFSTGNAIEEAKISDVGLQNLSRLDIPTLRLLDLGYCANITDNGLTYVRKMKSVKRLSLVCCPGISDRGLSNLRGMNGLRELDLRGNTRITDDGIAHLAVMRNLQMIELGGCENVTRAGVRKLQKRMPNTKVEKDEREWSFH